MALADLKKRLGKWFDVDEIRGSLENLREELLGRFDSRLLDRAADFVDRQKGRWEHQDWEGFLDDLKREGYEISGEMRDQVGLLLERFKELYPKGDLKNTLQDLADPATAKEKITGATDKILAQAEKARDEASLRAAEATGKIKEKAEKAGAKAKETAEKTRRKVASKASETKAKAKAAAKKAAPSKAKGKTAAKKPASPPKSKKSGASAKGKKKT